MVEKLKSFFKPYTGLPKEIYFIFVIRIVNAMGTFIYPMFSLLLTKQMGYSVKEAGLIMGITSILFLPAGLLGGKLADSIGRKKIIIVFELMGIFCYAAAASVQPGYVMLLLLWLGGVSFSVTYPAYDALLADLTTPENREASYSLSYMGFNLGFAVGPIIGGFLFERNLMLFFLIDAITAFISLLLIILYINEPAIEEFSQLGAGQQVEDRKTPLWRFMIERPNIIIFILIVMGFRFIYSQWGFLLPNYLEMLYHNQGAEIYGFLSGVNGFVVIAFTPLITMLFLKKTPLQRISVSGLLYGVSFLIFGFNNVKLIFIIPVFLFTIGEILTMISVNPYIANRTPASHRGRVHSVISVTNVAGTTLGHITTGFLVDQWSYQIVWFVLTGVILLLLLANKVFTKYDQKELATVSTPCEQSV